MKKKAVFLDRDGVINEMVYHHEHGIIDSPFTVEEFVMIPNVGKAINRFHKQGYFVVVVSNKPGIAKKHYDMETFKKMKEKMKKELAKDKATIDAEYYCFHHPESKIEEYKKICDCRKPKPGMLFQAAKDHDINLKKSWMIGDGLTDIQAGISAGCKTILMGTLKCYHCTKMQELGIKTDFVSPNLYKASIITEKERM